MKIKRIVIWGLRKKWHTHRFIHKAFYENAKKLGYDVIWVEDEKKNTKLIKSGDLIISADPVGKMVPEKFSFKEYNIPVRDDVYYCLHNFKKIFIDKLPKDKLVFLQVYTNSVDHIDGVEKWSPVTFFDKKTKTLYQPWGTDLLDYEFKKPVFRKNKFVFWVGSVWNDKQNRGNISAIQEFKKILKKRGLKFVHIRFVPNWVNILLVRFSRLAPAIAGEWQVEHDYLPCRMFKNISYGQIGFSNVKKFSEILGDYNIEGELEEMVDKVLDLNKIDYINLILRQQEIIRYYTYKQALENVFRAFNS